MELSISGGLGDSLVEGLMYDNCEQMFATSGLTWFTEALEMIELVLEIFGHRLFTKALASSLWNGG